MGHSHSIYVFDSEYEESDYWQPKIYKRISHYISEGYGVVYVAEENENSAIQRFSRMDFPVEDYVESGALTIISRDVFYSPTLTSSVLTEQWNKIFSGIRRKNSGKEIKGLVGIGMPADSFFTSEMFQQRLVDYECVVAEGYDGSFEAMCCYTTDLLDKMPLRQIIMLLNAHENTAHKDDTLREWNNERGIDVIRRGLDEALGDYVSELVFKLLLGDFGMDKDAMISHPDRFENKLRILFGPPAAEIVLTKIRAELKREIVF
ncbi:MAG TPA: MEDS domain-containing protein [Nitrososphaera sp.]|nr:MEDS domain-containing protein [Nitrososphaera sp.]